MTTNEIIAFAKEKFGKDMTQEEAQAYLDKKLPIPDEVMELLSGGGDCGDSTPRKCWSCGQYAPIVRVGGASECEACGATRFPGQ